MLLVLHDAAGLVDSVFTESHSFFFFFTEGRVKKSDY